MSNGVEFCVVVALAMFCGGLLSLAITEAHIKSDIVSKCSESGIYQPYSSAQFIECKVINLKTIYLEKKNEQ